MTTVIETDAKPNVLIDVEFITPDVAKTYLAKNIAHNRKIKTAKVSGYARDIRAGKWFFTGEAIKFDADGNLIDGQNRLRGVMQAGHGAWFLVIYGIERDALPFLDSGITRTSADTIVMAEVAEKADANSLGATVRVHKAWKEGDLATAGSTFGGSQQITRPELLSYIGANPDLDFAARYARSLYKFLPLPVGAVATAFIEFSRIDMDATSEYFNRIRDGISEGPGDPFLTLMRRVAKDRQEPGAMPPARGLFYLFRTWNAFRSGENLTTLQTGSKASGWVQIPVPR